MKKQRFAGSLQIAVFVFIILLFLASRCKGNALGAVAGGCIGLAGTHLDLIQGAIFLAVAMIDAIVYTALDAGVIASIGMVHHHDFSFSIEI